MARGKRRGQANRETAVVYYLHDTLDWYLVIYPAALRLLLASWASM